MLLNAGLLDVLFLILLGCSFLCLLRVALGPTAPDRTVAIDALGTMIVGFCVLLTLYTGRAFYMNVALSWALLSFVVSIALAKYLEGKQFDE